MVKEIVSYPVYIDHNLLLKNITVKFFDVYEKAQLDNNPMVSMGDLNHDYKLDESSSNNPIYNIKMGYHLKQIIGQPTRETIETIQTSTTLDIILVFHPDLHKKNGVMKYNFSGHYLVYTESS